MIEKYLLAFSFPVISCILWRLGGSGRLYTFALTSKDEHGNIRKIFEVNVEGKKYWRRFVLPGVMFVWALISGIHWYYAAASCGLFILLSTCVPITLIGNDLTKYGQLYWWVPILSLIHSATLFPLCWPNWPVGLSAGVALALIQWVMIWLSNTKNSNGVEYVKWHWYELTYGALFGLLAVLLVWGQI